jgi:hypothetical protein
MDEDRNSGFKKSRDPGSAYNNNECGSKTPEFLHCFNIPNKRLTHILLFFNIDILVQRAK